MPLYVNPTSAPPSTVSGEITRNSAGFHPSIWGDKFLQPSNSGLLKTDVDHKEEETLQLLIHEVKRMLTAGDTTQQELMCLIDDTQRLGLFYHFEAEIDALLHHLKDSFQKFYSTESDDDLHEVALCFRLLRQEGHNVSSDVFSRFQDSNGKFKEKLVKDVRGMLSLFEATHLRVHGENILEDALEFTTVRLNPYQNSHSNIPLADLVGRAMQYPLHKSFNRMVARHYISVYDKFDWHKQVLLDLAKCDFNLVQKVHQRELGHITRWWKDLDYTNKLPFARDRVVECYFWVTGLYFEPQYDEARKFLTKVISLTSIVDDIYDVYGTIEELVQLTAAIDEWDISIIKQLPQYMRYFYKPLLDVFAEAEEESAKDGMPTYGIDYAKDEFKRLAKMYLHEAKWLEANYFPSFEEYMSVALASGGVKMLSVSSFVLMGNVATREVYEWMSKDPLILKGLSVICRLSDDIVGHEFEMQRPHIPSAVECLMKEYSVPKETAYDELRKPVINAWKDMNEECLHQEAPPKPLLTRVLNMARVINFLYDGLDGYTHSSTRTKDMITSILIDPISL